jgi:hypothetical protein
VQSQLLNPNPQARLRVYAMWVNKQVGDARSRWDAAGLTDRRVVHLWGLCCVGREVVRAGRLRP